MNFTFSFQPHSLQFRPLITSLCLLHNLCNCIIGKVLERIAGAEISPFHFLLQIPTSAIPHILDPSRKCWKGSAGQAAFVKKETDLTFQFSGSFFLFLFGMSRVYIFLPHYRPQPMNCIPQCFKLV